METIVDNTIKENFTFEPNGKNLIIKCFHCGARWNLRGKKLMLKEMKRLVKHYKTHYPASHIS